MERHDQGIWAVGLLCLAAVLAPLLSIGIPLLVSPEPVKLSDWLGFAGAIVGITGALLVGRIAVAPVWRQVNIMGAQAALQLYPILEQDLQHIDEDAVLLKRLWGIQGKVRDLSASIEFWEESKVALVEVLAQELSSVRHQIKSITPDDWTRFHSRLRTPLGKSPKRQNLQHLFDKINDHAADLVRQQHFTHGRPRAEYLASIADIFPNKVQSFVEEAAKVAALNLALNGDDLASERRRLLAKSDELQRAIGVL